MSKRKVTERVAVFVECVEEEHEDVEFHPEIRTPNDGTCFLLKFGASLPRPGELVVLQRTNKRPVWYCQDDEDDTSGRGCFATTGLGKDIYLWEIVRDGE